MKLHSKISQFIRNVGFFPGVFICGYFVCSGLAWPIDADIGGGTLNKSTLTVCRPIIRPLACSFYLCRWSQIGNLLQSCVFAGPGPQRPEASTFQEYFNLFFGVFLAYTRVCTISKQPGSRYWTDMCPIHAASAAGPRQHNKYEYIFPFMFIHYRMKIARINESLEKVFALTVRWELEGDVGVGGLVVCVWVWGWVGFVGVRGVQVWGAAQRCPVFRFSGGGVSRTLPSLCIPLHSPQDPQPKNMFHSFIWWKCDGGEGSLEHCSLGNANY